MATNSAIETLIDLATKETDEAAKRLGHAIRAGDETEKKLALLLQYREDYAARFQSDLSIGLTAMGYRNFQVFLEKLDSAITGQQQVVRDAQQRIERERLAWQESERKRMSYDTLASRAQKEEQRKENRRDQKLMDEHATRQTAYKR